MLEEIKTVDEEYYFIDEHGHKQGEFKQYWEGVLGIQCFYVNDYEHGEYKVWYESGNQLEAHYIYKNGQLHGEYKEWYENGQLSLHFFYVNGEPVSFNEIPYPTTPEELMYFKLKYDLPLLPKEDKC